MRYGVVVMGSGTGENKGGIVVRWRWGIGYEVGSGEVLMQHLGPGRHNYILVSPLLGYSDVIVCRIV